MKCILLSTLSTPAYAGEITDKEWNIIDDLVVTYFENGATDRADCTARNQQGEPIGGGFGYFRGSVERVSIKIPKKYVGKNLEVSCQGSHPSKQKPSQ